MPVKRWSELRAVGGDCRHHDIAAVARIAGDNESPRSTGKVFSLGGHRFAGAKFPAAPVVMKPED
jgi:hypothetical protein